MCGEAAGDAWAADEEAEAAGRAGAAIRLTSVRPRGAAGAATSSVVPVKRYAEEEDAPAWPEAGSVMEIRPPERCALEVGVEEDVEGGGMERRGPALFGVLAAEEEGWRPTKMV